MRVCLQAYVCARVCVHVCACALLTYTFLIYAVSTHTVGAQALFNEFKSLGVKCDKVAIFEIFSKVNALLNSPCQMTINPTLERFTDVRAWEASATVSRYSRY